MSRLRAEPAILDDVDRAILNGLQGDFPLCERPFALAAEKLGLDEATLIARLQKLLDDRVLTRFGPMVQIERLGGAFVLAALAVPEDRYDEVTVQVNSLPEVAHNYRREHHFNMWFVLATDSREGIAEACGKIETLTGLPVHAFPKEREYFVDMRLKV